MLVGGFPSKKWLSSQPIIPFLGSGESPPYPPALHLRPLFADHLRRQVVAPSQGLRSAEAALRGAGEAPAADGSIAGAVAAQQGAAAEGAGDGGLGNRQWRNGGEIKVSNLKHSDLGFSRGDCWGSWGSTYGVKATHEFLRTLFLWLCNTMHILCMFFISKSLDLRSTSEGSDQIWRNSMFSCGVWTADISLKQPGISPPRNLGRQLLV